MIRTIRDLQHALLTFETTEWGDPPKLVSTNKSETEEHFRKYANDVIYRSRNTATDWHRYITLGYYTVEDGTEFDVEWHAMLVDPLRIHRLFWYNYLYHIDREMQIPPKLDTWAVYVSRPYILENHIASLSMNTQIPWKSQRFDQDVEMAEQAPQNASSDKI